MRVATCLPDIAGRSKREVHLDMATVLMVIETSTESNACTRNAVDTARIARVLAIPCHCADAGVCQARTLSFNTLCLFLQRFHSLTTECKAHLISTAYDTAGPKPEDRAPRTAWHLLGVRICVDALAALLGMSH